jgi:multidrug efflux pump subunit AcrA (membrane-fusion protein)
MTIAVTARGLVTGAGLVALSLALPSHEASAQADASPGASVNVVKATSACFSDMLRVAGYLVPKRVAIVNVESENYKITEVSAAEGDQVSSGQVMARLTKQESQSGGGGQQQQQQQQRQTPTNITLKAPTAGLVIKSTARVREMASPQAEPLFQILGDNEVELEAQIPSIHVSKLKSGELARVAIAGLSERVGKVRLVGPEIDKKTQLGKVRIALGSDPALRIGTFASANIDASRSCGVAVPRDAVDYRMEGGTSVRVVRDHTVEMRRVTIGLVSDDSVEVRAGLNAGEVVVSNAGTSLHDGDKVKPKFAEDLDQSRGR